MKKFMMPARAKQKPNYLIGSLAILCTMTFSSCASTSKNKDDKIKSEDIISQPLTDIGLIKKGIAPALVQITDPYAYPAGMDCTSINYQLEELNKVLGAEIVKGANYDDRNLSEKGGAMASAAAKDAVKSAAVGFIPARGVVRKLTGAEKAEKELNKATELGKIRRGFLRGLSIGLKCPN